MPQEMTLTLEERSGRGQNASRRLRREGRLPAVVYGDGSEPKAVTVSKHNHKAANMKTNTFTRSKPNFMPRSNALLVLILSTHFW